MSSIIVSNIVDLLLISGIMTLIYKSGFFEVVDDWISHKYRFYHLPYPFHCCLCGTWWMCLLYIVVTGQVSLLSIFLCLVAAYSTNVLSPLFKLVENFLLKIIECINVYFNL